MDKPAEIIFNNSFGIALEESVNGYRIARKEMHANGGFVVHQKGYPDGIPINQNTADATGLPKNSVQKFAPYFMVFDGVSFAPYIPSQADMNTADWGLV